MSKHTPGPWEWVNLIAAAPEMYEALEDCLDELGGMT